MLDAKEVLTIALGLFNLLILGFSALIWFNYQDLKSKTETALKEAAEFKIYCARTYVTQDGLTQAITNLEKTIGSLVDAVKSNMEESRENFRAIYSKIDSKQDK